MARSRTRSDSRESTDQPVSESSRGRNGDRNCKWNTRLICYKVENLSDADDEYERLSICIICKLFDLSYELYKLRSAR